MKDLAAFFTRIPLKGDLEKAREEIWLLPFLGLLTAVIPSLVFYFSPLMKGLLSIISLYMLIGIIHLDGLADFFDGVMAKGGADEKIRVMKSSDTGVAGVFAVVSILLIQILALGSIPLRAFWLLWVAEVNSKLSMVMLLKRDGFLDGVGRFFSEGLSSKKLLLAIIVYILCLILIFALSKSVLLFILTVCLLTPFYISRISLKNFGGLNGDCIGASAELTRALTLLFGSLLFYGW